MKLINIKNILSLPLDVIETKYTAALEDYKKACKNSPELADTHMDSLHEAMANKNHTSIAAEKKKHLNIQRQKEAGRALAILKRKERPMVSKVFITMENGRIECANKEKIEWACIKENQRRFTQVHDTSPRNKKSWNG